MPRLSKIRLTGCKYDGQRKEHENSIFDLTKNGQPDHSLFTLFNGGGKGVMMQLIFQILLPETKWGKNNGNKISSMFYDQRNNLNPFTFHVVLEWVLDTVPEKRLIAGIAVKAIIKNTGNDEDEKTGLSYFLYTYEHDNNEYLTVENLPLYDKSTGTAVDMDVFERFINENNRYFIKYSQSSVRRSDAQYYTYLESRGIYRSEWINLKAINKSEGGAGDYFIGASDNKAIFDKIIIPVIGENIRNYTYEDGDSLIGMFISNFSITKDLPVLIKREGDFKDLSVEIKPLIENADSGSRFLNMKDRLIEEGNDICFILKEEERSEAQEIEKWSHEAKGAEEERKELTFKKDNLGYNQKKRDLEAEIKKIERLELELDEKSGIIEEKQEELCLYKINEVLFRKKETEQEIANKTEEKYILIEALDISDSRKRAEELDDEIGLEWEQTQKHWKNHEHQYIAYVNYLNQEIHKNNREKKQYEDRVNVLQSEILKFEIREEGLKAERRKLEESYDPMSLLYPERILEDLIEMKEKAEKKLAVLTIRIQSYKDKASALLLEITKFEYSLEDKKRNADSLREKLREKEEQELNLVRRLMKLLLENYDGSLLNHAWFIGKLENLEETERQKKRKLEELQRTIWEKSIDHLLNKEDYFIPNKDVVLIKEEIKKLGIYAETGTEYLKGLNEKEKASLLEQYPGFLYSVVIKSQKDWELVDKNIGQDLFLNSMVPVYVRSEMQSNGKESFRSIAGKAYELVDSSQYVDWKDTMKSEIAGLSQTEENIHKDLKAIADIKEELRFICKSETAWELNQRLKEEEKNIAELYDKIRLKKEEILNMKKQLDQAEAELMESDTRLTRINASIEQMKDFIEKAEAIEQEKISISKVIAERDKLRTDITGIGEDVERLQSTQETVRDAYLEWKTDIKNIVNSINEVYKKAIYTEERSHSDLNHRVPEFLTAADTLLVLVKERKAVESDIAGKNSSIASLNTELKYLKKDMDRHIMELKKIRSNWADYSYLELPISELGIAINGIDRELEKLKEERAHIKSLCDTGRGIIRSKEEQIQNIEAQILKEHKRPAVILDIEDIPSEADFVERDLQSNQKYAVICAEELQKNKDRNVKLEINLAKINSGYSLDAFKGKMDEDLKDKIQENLDFVVDEWLRDCNRNMSQIVKTREEGERFRSRFIKKIEFSLEEDKLKEKIITIIKEANISNFKSNLISFKSMENHFQQELLRLTRDKEKAEEAMKQWTHRASVHVLRMVEALKDMVAGMNYINEQGYVFPLVKLKGAERLPKEEIEIAYLLDEYFVQIISELLEKNQDISNMNNNELKELMGDKVIFSKALQGRYPTLLVYKMSEKNEFRYARARDEYYTTWEALNKGEGDLPEGSGGQTLSVNTFVIMMLMSFKKKHIGNENPSTVLILDNPFGKASAKHVLDPIFEIADKLNFQLICFAAPEIIKVEISERFPIFWELKVEEGKIVHGGRIVHI